MVYEKKSGTNNNTYKNFLVSVQELSSTLTGRSRISPDGAEGGNLLFGQIFPENCTKIEIRQ